MGSVFVWKDVLHPGTQRTPDGRWFTISRRDTAAAAENCRKMIGRGISIPCVWEHLNVEAGDPDAWKARYAKYTFGRVNAARVDPDGVLWLRHEVYDPADARQLAKTKYVSPKVYPAGYSDSLGGEYRGATIAHVASTPTPLQVHQKPFRLSAPEMCPPQSGGDWQRPFAMSAADALYLSYTPEGTAVAEEGEKKETPKAGDGGGGTGELGKLLDALRSVGLNIPDEVTDVPGLIIAVKASGGPKGGAGDDLDDGLGEEPGRGGQVATAGGPPVMMSTLDRDPEARRRAQAWARDERADLRARVKALFQSGRVDRPAARQLQRQAEAVDMSFTRDGEAVHPLNKKLAELEKRPAHSAWKPDGRTGTELSATRPVGVPETLAGVGGPEGGTKEATDLVLSLIPGPPPKA